MALACKQVVVDTLRHLRGAVVRAKSKCSRACAAAVSAGRHINGAAFGVTKKNLKTPVAGTVIQGPQSGCRAASLRVIRREKRLAFEKR